MDLIERQVAIDAFYKHPNIDWTTLDVLAKINALPSAQPETHDKRTKTHSCDLIDRQAAIEALDKRFDSIPMEQTTEILLLRKDLRELPPAQPERQKGEWIDYTEDGYVECPFCHSATNCDGNKDELHFCFSCGADMREDGAEQDG